MASSGGTNVGSGERSDRRSNVVVGELSCRGPSAGPGAVSGKKSSVLAGVGPDEGKPLMKPVNNRVSGQCWYRVNHKVRYRVIRQVYGQVIEQAYSQVREQVYQVEDSLWQQLQEGLP